jgi:histidinol-phosphate aminotransferase
MTTIRSAESAGPRPAAVAASARAYRRPPDPGPIDLRLDANECAFAPAELLAAADGRDMGRYPSTGEFEALLARRWGVPAERVLATAGADDALYRACAAVLEAGREAVIPSPTFEMIDRYIALTGGRAVRVPWMDRHFPVDAVVAAGRSASAAFVVSPNNPTGLVASSEDVRRLRAALPAALIVLDAAYGEFSDDDPTDAVLGMPGVVVMRTLSKAWGLAGLRVGYAIGDERVIGWMRAVGQPYPVSGPSLAAAARWLAEGEAVMRRVVSRVRRERGELVELMRSLGAEPVEGQANFVLCRFRDAGAVCDALARRGIGVRAFPDRPGLERFLRITCPADDHGQARLVAALRETLPRTEARA